MTKTTYKERDEDKPEPLGSWAEAFAADLKRAAERIARKEQDERAHNEPSNPSPDDDT
jgi:hypothetical protein